MGPAFRLGNAFSILGAIAARTSYKKLLWAAVAALTPLAWGCNDVLGFVPGKPYPPDGGDGVNSMVDGSMLDGPSADRSMSDGNVGGGQPDGGEAGCSGTQCGPTCTDTSMDPKHCGGCNHDCMALTNIGKADGITCAAGRCVIPPTSCATGFAHCSTDPDDGCETDIGTAAHCGSCTKACSADAALCAGAECVKSCPAMTPTLCGSTCVDLDTDPAHCGDCTKACARPPSGGNPTCSSKTCGFSCLANWHSCPGTTDCAPDNDATRCGPMCMKCPGTTDGDPNGDAVCVNNQCGLQCHANYTKCSNNTCVDATNDPKNCGSCGHDCTALAGVGSATGIKCTAGKCVIPPSACSPGRAHCTANADDGCETDTTKPANCNGCGGQCPIDKPICAAAGCKNECPAATPTLCNGTTCSNLDSDANHCGDCVKACVQPASGGTTTCDSRTCTVHCFDGKPACAGNCPNYQTDNLNCGTCGHPCANGTTCKSGVCCSATQTNCGGSCVDISSDPDHCGACTGAVCPDVSGGTRHCVNRSCSPTCNSGRLLCSGTCCAAAPPNATMSCDVGICTPHCLGATLACTGGSTQCGSWNFESNTGEGWQADLSSPSSATNFRVKSAPGGGLAFAYDLNNGSQGQTFIRVPICNGPAAARNFWVSGRVYAEGPPITTQSMMTNAAYFLWSDSGGNLLGATPFVLLSPANTWLTVGDSSASLYGDGLASLSLVIYVESGWAGTVYVDNIQLH